MAKYRILSESELKTFEKEFVDYLVVNGITADDWVKMKTDENEKALKIVDLFSDVILESVLRKIQFLEIRTNAYVQAIQCLDEKMIMIAISSKDVRYKMTDLNPETPKDVISEYFELHQGEKNYDGSREMALFEMTEKGYEISDGKLFKTLLMASVE